MRFRPLIFAVFSLLTSIGAASADSTSPAGTWRDVFGTTFAISLCGPGTDLCAVLKDVRGRSRTSANLAYVNRRVLRAHQTAQNQWQGTLIYNGSEAQATVTLITADTMSIKGCRGIFCGVLVFRRS
jgi:uncharacterized protein (DUF2147 family)